MDSSPALFPIPALFPVIFAVMWIGILFIVAQTGGWARLSQKYRCESSFFGSCKGWCYGKFGFASYKQTLWIGVAAEGLYIKTGPVFLYRAFHPPLLIPWSKISSVAEGRYWGRHIVEVQLSDPAMKIVLDYRALEDSQRFLGTKLKLLEKKTAD